VKVGAPTLEGVAVHGEIADQRRADKIIVFKKKRRKTYRRKQGHRQHETVVRITALGGAAPKPAAKAKVKTEKAESRPARAEAEKAETKPAAETKSATDLPVLFLAAPKGEPDDLKKLSGVGPAIEKKLNAVGLYHFAQVAALTADDVAKLEDALHMHGRVERDGWIEQAKRLAQGE
jgi:large subunit ribosomal protein L21